MISSSAHSSNAKRPAGPARAVGGAHSRIDCASGGRAHMHQPERSRAVDFNLRKFVAATPAWKWSVYFAQTAPSRNHAAQNHRGPPRPGKDTEIGPSFRSRWPIASRFKRNSMPKRQNSGQLASASYQKSIGAHAPVASTKPVPDSDPIEIVPTETEAPSWLSNRPRPHRSPFRHGHGCRPAIHDGRSGKGLESLSKQDIEIPRDQVAPSPVPGMHRLRQCPSGDVLAHPE